MPVDFSAAAIHDEEYGFGGSVLVFNDITERKNVEQQLMRLARYDELTGLANRTLFREFLRKSMARAKRGGRLMGLLFVDLDRFKAVNDAHGHEAGNVVLRSVSAEIRGAVRASDLAARYGGDEFVVLLTRTDLTGAGRVAEAIRAGIEGVGRRLGYSAGFVTASIGLAEFDPGDPDSGDLLVAADRALYVAKSKGRNVVADRPDNRTDTETVHIEAGQT